MCKFENQFLVFKFFLKKVLNPLFQLQQMSLQGELDFSCYLSLTEIGRLIKNNFDRSNKRRGSNFNSKTATQR